MLQREEILGDDDLVFYCESIASGDTDSLLTWRTQGALNPGLGHVDKVIRQLVRAVVTIEKTFYLGADLLTVH
jgi:hypothetical protein